MNDQELVNKLRTHLEVTRKIGLYPGKSGIWAVIEQASDQIANQSTHIAALQQEIEKLRRQVPRWIPVDERLPENFRKVLCWGEYFRYGDFNGKFVNYALGYQNNGRWGGEVANGTNARALAWMPLPEPPKVK
nr:MAG TPA: Protein of unknown function (DUF551) [Caudoviricetes sp.]